MVSLKGHGDSWSPIVNSCKLLPEKKKVLTDYETLWARVLKQHWSSPWRRLVYIWFGTCRFILVVFSFIELCRRSCFLQTHKSPSMPIQPVTLLRAWRTSSSPLWSDLSDYAKVVKGWIKLATTWPVVTFPFKGFSINGQWHRNSRRSAT